MRYKKTVNVQTILETSTLANLMEKGVRLNQLNEQLHPFFPKEFYGFYKITHMTEETLFIDVAHASIRQGFLFKQAALLQAVNQTYPQIKQFTFTINPQLKSLPASDVEHYL
ncbi:DciA family protein [[Pasteurella] aerogenes]